MKKCKKCEALKDEGDFYKNDSTCKTCRCAMVRANRERNAEYYREYDRKRFQEDPKVKQRHVRYQKTEAGAESMKKSRDKWLSENQTKRACHVLLGNAVRDGRLLKPNSCNSCGISGVRIHGHHDDYAKPLEVRWLCSKCHRSWREENGEGLNAHQGDSPWHHFIT